MRYLKQQLLTAVVTQISKHCTWGVITILPHHRPAKNFVSGPQSGLVFLNKSPDMHGRLTSIW